MGYQGESVKYQGVSVLETDNGQVRCFRTYYAQLSSLPGARRNLKATRFNSEGLIFFDWDFIMHTSFLLSLATLTVCF